MKKYNLSLTCDELFDLVGMLQALRRSQPNSFSSIPYCQHILSLEFKVERKYMLACKIEAIERGKHENKD